MTTRDETSDLLLPKYLQDERSRQSMAELLASLPKERGWVASYLYQYQGFWHPARQLQGVIACQSHFQAQDSDVLLVTTPKSGTTWLKALAFALLNRRCHHFSDQEHPLYTNNPHVLVPFLDSKIYVDTPNPDLSSYESPRLFATHLPFVSMPKSVQESECKIVYLCRNPKDTFVSIWHFTNKLRPEGMGSNLFEDTLEKFCKGVSLYGPFWDHVLGYWKQSLENPRRVLFLKYEDLKENPGLHLRKLAEFLGCPFSCEEEEGGIVEDIRICSFEKLRNLEVNKTRKLSSGEENRAFFRKGEVGDWKNFLTDEMADRLNRLAQETLRPFGLEL